MFQTALYATPPTFLGHLNYHLLSDGLYLDLSVFTLITDLDCLCYTLYFVNTCLSTMMPISVWTSFPNV